MVEQPARRFCCLGSRPKRFFFWPGGLGEHLRSFFVYFSSGNTFFVLTKMLKICAKYVPKIKSGNTLLSCQKDRKNKYKYACGLMTKTDTHTHSSMTPTSTPYVNVWTWNHFYCYLVVFGNTTPVQRLPSLSGWSGGPHPRPVLYNQDHILKGQNLE